MAATITAPKWTVADRLRKAREDAELGQDELARKIGVARSTVSNYERGKSPRKPILRLWAEETGVTYEWLLDGYSEASDLPFTGFRCTRPFQQSLWDSEPETGRATDDSRVHAYAA